jgi:hypothetical protein
MIGEARASVTRRFSGIGKKDVSTGKKTFILIGFCTAQLLDVTTTHIGLSQGRQELNGVAAWIIQNNGELAVYALKARRLSSVVRPPPGRHLERLPDRRLDHDVCRGQQSLSHIDLTGR